MPRHLHTLLLGLTLTLIISACSDSGTEPEDNSNGNNGEVSFSAQVQPLLQASCGFANCHGAATQSGFSVASYGSITGSAGHGRLLLPNFADSTNLYLKLLDPPPFGARMPASGPPFLSTSNINLIRDWINQGAKNN